MAYKRSYSNSNSNSNQDPSKGDVVIELDKKKQVTIRKFNNINLVDIREFYVDKDTKEKKPGKKGISLTEETWKRLLESASEVQDALDKLNGINKKGITDTEDEPKEKKLKTEETQEEEEEERKKEDESEAE